MKVLLLHNPKAGDVKFDRHDLTAMLRKAGCEVVYLPTDSPALEQALRDPADLVVVAGGDGTVARVLSNVTVTPHVAPLTILPLGTANNLARAVGIRGEIPELIAGLRDGRLVPLDFGLTEGPWGHQRFFESAGFGAIARALAPVNESKVPSAQKIPQGRQALQAVLEEQPAAPMRITLDDREISEDLLMVELINIASIGPKLCIAPTADPGDGYLHVACLSPRRREAALEWLNDPESHGPAPVELYMARRVTVQWSGTPSHLDDFFHDAPEKTSRMSAWLEPAAINLLVPGTRAG